MKKFRVSILCSAYYDAVEWQVEVFAVSQESAVEGARMMFVRGSDEMFVSHAEEVTNDKA